MWLMAMLHSSCTKVKALWANRNMMRLTATVSKKSQLHIYQNKTLQAQHVLE